MSRSRDIPDDSDEKWAYSEHIAAKHEVLTRYLGAWFPILGKHYPKLTIYDGFAGRGRYTTGEEGSPLLIYRRAVEAVEAGRVQSVEIVCVEANPGNFRQLSEELAELKHPRVSIRPRNDTFDVIANEVADRAELPGGRPPPIFFTADPYGFRGVPLRTIERLLRIQSLEVLVTFMVRDQRRFLKMGNIEGTLAELFGGDAWRPCREAEDADRCLVQAYRKVILDGQIAEFATPFQVHEDERRTTLYYLVHLTNNGRGMREMKEAMVETSSDMTFWPVTVRPRDQLVLEVQEPAPYPSLQERLLEKYAGRTLTFEELLNDDYSDGVWIESEYRAAVKDLAARDPSVSISYDRATQSGRSPYGLKLDDSVSFAVERPLQLDI